MNGAIYINDPDVVFLRSKNCLLSETEKELIALVNYLLAGQILCSDDFLSLGKEDLSFAMMINEVFNELPCDQYGAAGLEKDVYRLESRSGRITGIINLSDKPYLFTGEKNCFSGGVWLINHRQKSGDLCFAPRSISIYSCTKKP
jgi:alpha-galactosidase